MKNKDKVILDLCGGTGSWSKYYTDNDYDVRLLTLPYFDVMTWHTNKELNDMIHTKQIYGILAAPPCTMFSIARCDKTAKQPRNLREGMETVQACLDIIHECLYVSFRKNEKGLQFWALENPYTEYLKRFLGLPPLVFHPFEYGDKYTKLTAIWGEFNFPTKSIVSVREVKKIGGNSDFVSCIEQFADLKEIPKGYQEVTKYSKRQILRSMTPLGFSKAFFIANQ